MSPVPIILYKPAQLCGFFGNFLCDRYNEYPRIAFMVIFWPFLDTLGISLWVIIPEDYKNFSSVCRIRFSSSAYHNLNENHVFITFWSLAYSIVERSNREASALMFLRSVSTSLSPPTRSAPFHLHMRNHLFSLTYAYEDAENINRVLYLNWWTDTSSAALILWIQLSDDNFLGRNRHKTLSKTRLKACAFMYPVSRRFTHIAHTMHTS